MKRSDDKNILCCGRKLSGWSEVKRFTGKFCCGNDRSRSSDDPTSLAALRRCRLPIEVSLAGFVLVGLRRCAQPLAVSQCCLGVPS